MADSIIIALITAGFPTLTTAITAVCQSRATKKNANDQSLARESKLSRLDWSASISNNESI